MFREVQLPDSVAGRLLLHSMPGRREPFDDVLAAAARERVATVVRLVDLDSIRWKSPDYADALANGRLPFEVLACEIPDFGVPDDRIAFWGTALDVARRLRRGEVVLVHCWAGIGRTGTFAASVLVALGEPLDPAEDAVATAGSWPETDEQRELVAWCAHRASRPWADVAG